MQYRSCVYAECLVSGLALVGSPTAQHYCYAQLPVCDAMSDLMMHQIPCHLRGRRICSSASPHALPELLLYVVLQCIRSAYGIAYHALHPYDVVQEVPALLPIMG